MSTNANFNELKSLILSLEYELNKFETKKVKVSGQRVRNSLLTVKKLADKMRKEISDKLKELPVRSLRTVPAGEEFPSPPQKLTRSTSSYVSPS